MSNIALFWGALFFVCCVQQTTSTATLPILLSQSTYFPIDRGVGGIFTNPNGVGRKSPFLFLDDCDHDETGVTSCGNIRSIHDKSGRVHRESTDNAISISIAPPLVNYGTFEYKTPNVTTYVVADGDVIVSYMGDGVDFEQWVYDLSGSSVALSMTFVEQKHAQCYSGFGGVSVLSCDFIAFGCVVTVLDFHSGDVCRQGNVTTIPAEYQFSQATVKAQGFSSGGALGRPMIVVAQTATNILYGIDAVSGETIYAHPFNDTAHVDFNRFVPGSSPTNELFAFLLYDEESQQYQVAIHSIENGDLRKQVPLKNTLYFLPHLNSAAWGPSATSRGGIFLFATELLSGGGKNNNNNNNSIVSINAADGQSVVHSLSVDEAATPLDTPMATLNNWTVGVRAAKNGTVLMTCVEALQRETMSLVVPGGRWTNALVTSFRFDNGTKSVVVAAFNQTTVQLSWYVV